MGGGGRRPLCAAMSARRGRCVGLDCSLFPDWLQPPPGAGNVGESAGRRGGVLVAAAAGGGRCAHPWHDTPCAG
eukprot:2283023-Lingulodinium_polyedra.AAC.1